MLYPIVPQYVKRSFNEGAKLTLDKAIQIAQNYEYCQTQLKTMGPTAHQQVEAVSTQKPHGRKKSANGPTKKGKMPTQTTQNVCRCCGTRHDQRTNCPAKEATCFTCSKLNHFAKQSKSQRNVISVNQIGDDSD